VTPTPSKLLLKGARLVDPARGFEGPADVLVVDGRIADVGGRALRSGSGVTTIDCDGLVVAPGLVDLHAHLREPGREDKETVESGSRAAALGGYTAIAAMANTDPVADTAAVIQEILALADKAGLCEVHPVGAITKGLEGETLAEIGEMASLGVRMFSDDGHGVQSARVMRLALEYAKAFDVVMAVHCEDTDLTEGAQMHEGYHSATLGLRGWPAEAEELMVARDVFLARRAGGRLHVCHLSTAGSVDLVARAKADGLRITAEVTPHHLTFTDGDLTGYDTNFKVNPPLRSPEDRDALREGLATGTVDAVATDHAPHADEEKEQEFDLSPSGTIGLETALAVVLTELVEPGLIPLARAIGAMSTTPAAILGLPDHGGPVEPGRPANLVVFDPTAEWVVGPPFASKSKNSAFTRRTLRGRVIHTMLGGELTVRDGEATR
jgi:dihydroorotase